MDKGGPGWNLVTRVDQGGPWQTWVRHTSNGHLPHNTCTLGLRVLHRAAVLVQIYLRSCCVGEARTELVAAQSVKTGPGRCGSRCCTNPLYFPPQSTFHGQPRLFNERSCKTQWIWIWKRDLVRFRRNIGHSWVVPLPTLLTSLITLYKQGGISGTPHV